MDTTRCVVFPAAAKSLMHQVCSDPHRHQTLLLQPETLRCPAAVTRPSGHSAGQASKSCGSARCAHLQQHLLRHLHDRLECLQRSLQPSLCWLTIVHDLVLQDNSVQPISTIQQSDEAKGSCFRIIKAVKGSSVGHHPMLHIRRRKQVGQMGCCLAAGVAVPAVDELLSQAAYTKPETIPKYYTQLQHSPCQDQVPSSKLATCSRHERLH